LSKRRLNTFADWFYAEEAAITGSFAVNIDTVISHLKEMTTSDSLVFDVSLLKKKWPSKEWVNFAILDALYDNASHTGLRKACNVPIRDSLSYLREFSSDSIRFMVFFLEKFS